MTNSDTYSHFMQTVADRYSCRNYDAGRNVPRELVEAVVEAARLAPSADNRQPWTFVAVTDRGLREQILSKSRPAFLEAPVLIVACGHHDRAWHRPSDGKDHTDVDVSIAAEHLCLAATTLGLATCWVCSFDTHITRTTLGLPDDVEPIALFPLGWPADATVPEKRRKSLDEILKWEKF